VNEGVNIPLGDKFLPWGPGVKLKMAQWFTGFLIKNGCYGLGANPGSFDFVPFHIYR
jgi:hypothetical protein